MQSSAKNTSSPMTRINKMGYIFILPFFFFYILFNLYPIFYSLWLSFHEWNGLGAKTFVGLQNYVTLFTKDPYFWKAIGNTLLIMLGYIPTTIVLALLIATLLYNKAIKNANVFQTMQFLPYIVAGVSIGTLFRIMFDWSGGIVNTLLLQWGILSDAPNWLGHPQLSRLVLVFLFVWTQLGYVVTLFLAGMTSISADVLEAADVDGATYLQKLTRIIVPLLRPIMLFVILTGTIGGLQMFDEPKILFAGGFGVSAVGGPMRNCLTAVWYMQDTAFGGSTGRLEIGYGSAIAYGLFIIIAIFSIINYKVIGGKEEK